MRIRLSIATGLGIATAHECAGPIVRIGRAAECELAFPGDATSVVSRNHARIELSAGGAKLTDAGSRNGTLLNDRKIDGSVPLGKGDRIRLGQTGPTLTVLEVDLSEPPAPQAIGAEAGTARVARRESVVDTEVDRAPYSAGPWVAEQRHAESIPQPVDSNEHFAPPGRRTWLLVAVSILFVVGLAGCLGYFLFRTTEQYGQYGGIEIGASGIKMFAGDFYHDGKSWNYRTVIAKDKNVDLGKRIAAGGQSFEPDALNDAIDAVRAFFEEMRDKGVPSNRIYIMCSSGVFATFKDQNAKSANEDKLSQEVRRAFGKDVDFLDEAGKAKYDLLACSPDPKERGKSLLIHIGSGDTKGGYYTGSDVFEAMSFKYGSSSYQKEVEKRRRPGETFDEGARRVAQEELIPCIRKDIESRKGLNERPTVYLFGGVVWAMTTYMHPRQWKDQHVRLRANDIKRFRDWVATSTSVAMAKSALDAGDPEQKEALEQEVKKIQEVFKEHDQLIAGAEILAALSTEYNFEGKDLESFHDTNYACIIGYIAKTAEIER